MITYNRNLLCLLILISKTIVSQEILHDSTSISPRFKMTHVVDVNSGNRKATNVNRNCKDLAQYL